MKKLGKNQQALVDELATGKVIRAVRDYRFNTYSAYLEDEDKNNTYRSVSLEMIQSLSKRGLLTYEEEYRSLEVETYVFRLREPCAA